jgi:hypothetical protein
MLNLLKKKIKLKIPLSEICYHDPDIGISFHWNQLQLLIPYHRLPIKASIGPLLEEFKTSLHGKGTIAIYLECHRLTFNIEITDVKISKAVIQRFSDFTSRIEGIVKQITSLVEKDSLNLEKTQIVLYQNGFQFDDSQVHRILTKIINSLPPRKTMEKLPFPLSHLSYNSKGIRFYNRDTQFDVDKKKLPVEVGPAMERIKNNFTGDITFHIETSYLHRWDTGQERLQVGQISREVKDIEVSPGIPRIFKTLRSQFIIESIKERINAASISLDAVKNLLEEWGLNLKHQEIAYELVSNIAPWTQEKDINVPLKDITYHDDGIVVPAADQNMRISAGNLSFRTNQLLENIKQTFEGYIKIHVYQSLQLAWDEEKEQLTIEKNKAVKVKMSMDDETVNRLKKIYWLYIEKGVEISTDSTLPDQHQYPADESPQKTEEPGLLDTDAVDHTIETQTTEEPVREKEESFMDLPRPVEQVPLSELTNKDYDAKCIHILEKMSDQIYMTTQDLWFRIGDCLIWERPEKDSATHVFEWPEEDLEFFVGKIWIADSHEIREHKEETGYITRINHIPDDVSRWERYLKRAVKKKTKE